MGEELAVIAPPTPPPAQTATPPEEAEPPEATPGAKPSRAESVAAILRAQRGLGVQVAGEEAAKGEEPPSDEADEAKAAKAAKSSDEKPPAETPSGFDSLDAIEAEREWTPEKIQQAAAYIQQKQQKLAGHWKASDRRRVKVEGRLKELESQQKAVEDTQAELKPYIDAINQLRTGTQEARLHALAHLTGLPASTALELLSTGVTEEMDRAATKEGQLEAKVAELERVLREREETEQRERAWQQELRAVEDGFRKLLMDSERWPLLSKSSEGKLEDVVAYLRDDLVERFNRGFRLTLGDLCDKVEQDLARKARERGPREVSKTPSPESGATRRTQQAAAETTTTVDHRKKGLHTSEAEKLEGVAAVLRRMRER